MTDISKSPTSSQFAEITWFGIDEVGLPPKEHDEFYNDRYSCPVLVANAYTGQTEPHTVVYDYQDG